MPLRLRFPTRSALRPLAAALLVGGLPAPLDAQEPSSGDLKELLGLLNTPVISATQSEQSIQRAPAKIVAITAEEIRRRGYQDLEEVFHDLAGVDFAFGRGVEWSTVFLRGMRTDNTDHFLLIWDGVIQNDLWKSNVWLSRQYPLLNIARIEVMYGPSSLLYGANAFGGIVNVILKKPKDAGIQAQAGTGDFRTRWAEVNVGRDTGDWRWSLNARAFTSDEMDLNGASWVDNAGRRRYYAFDLARDGLRDPSQPSGYAAGLKVGADGVPRWSVNGADVPFDGRATGDTRDWFVQAGVGWRGFDLKAYAWSRREIEDAWYVPLRRMHGPWTPEGSAVYATHVVELRPGLSLKTSLRTVSSGLDGDDSYDAGFTRAISNPANPDDLKVSSLGAVDYFELHNREWRAGQQANLETARISSVFGWEFTSTRTFEDYNLRRLKTEPWRTTPVHTERNLAAFANVQVDVFPTFLLTAGLRYDHNGVAGEAGGFGDLWTGRTAAVFSPSEAHRFKVIHGQAFQAPSPWQKFATVPGDRVANPFLNPERLTSTELIYEASPSPRWRSTLSVYHNQVADRIELGRDPVSGLNQNQNRGSLRIFGQEVESRYFLDARNSVYLNATFNSSRVPETGARQGGLAAAKANVGADLLFAGRWSLNLRAHAMSGRDVPLERLDQAHPGTNAVKVDGEWVLASAARRAGGYLTLDAVLTWLGALRGLDLRLGVYNLGDRAYYDPGTRIPDGRGNNALILQQPRRAFLSVTYRY